MAADGTPGPAPLLVLVRHGESASNASRRFTGWRDAALTELGREQARAAGGALRDVGGFDAAFSSFLQRAQHTARELLRASGQADDVTQCWRLNERHCGAFQGLHKEEVRERFGASALRAFREEWRARPPLAEVGGPDDPAADPRYLAVEGPLPRGESLEDLAERVARCWREELAPQLLPGRRVLVVAHAISLRALLRAALAHGLCGDAHEGPPSLPAHDFANAGVVRLCCDGPQGRARLLPDAPGV